MAHPDYYKDRIEDAIKYLKEAMEQGFYSPDREYLEVLIYAANQSLACAQTVSNTQILCFILGWQGGTVHQVADKLNRTVTEIVNADYNQMQDLMRLAQEKARTE